MKKNTLLRFIIGFVAIFAVIAAVRPWRQLPRAESTFFADEREDAEEGGPSPYPSEWAWMQRTFPYWTADEDIVTKVLQQRHEFHRLAAKTGRVLPRWELAGPTNIGGRVSALAFDPVDPRVVYAGAATGGVFKSIDGGTTWLPIFDDQAILPIGDIAVDPKNPAVVYVGTGEANGGHNNFPGAGLFKSTDGGDHWQLLGLENTTTIARIVIDPQTTQRLFVAAIGSYFAPDGHRGVYRSGDGGNTWQQAFFVDDSSGVIDLVIDPQNPQILHAAVWTRVRPPLAEVHFSSPQSGIYRSEDGGNSWRRLAAESGLPARTTNAGRIGLAICASQPENMYSLFTDGYTYMGLYRSRNRGLSWEQADPNRVLANGFGNFSWYFGQVRVHPTNPEKIFVLDVALWLSDDGGITWTNSESQNSNLHVDHHALVFNPQNSAQIIEGNDGGIYNSGDGGVSWSKVRALPVTQFYNIAYDPTRPERLYGGTQDNGTIRTTTGNAEDWRGIFGGDGFYVLIDPNNANRIYAEAQFGALGRSRNDGGSWLDATNGIDPNEPRDWATPVVMNPQNANSLFYGTNRLYKTTDQAASWSAISPQLTDYAPGRRMGTITTIAVAPSDSNVIYLGTDDSHVWVTDDGGDTWNEISQLLPYRWVTRVQVDPVEASVAYVTFSGLKWREPQPHVFRTADRGASWQDISGNLPEAPVNCLVIDPRYREVLFVATDVGVFVSKDAGASWVLAGSGLPVVSVYDLAIDDKNRFLLAGTHGRSMYRIRIDSVLTDLAPARPVVSEYRLYQNYPNPFNAGTRIAFDLPVETEVSLRIYNVLGEEIATLIDGRYPVNHYEVHWAGTDAKGARVGSGVYFYRLCTGNRVEQKKMTLLQ